MLAAPEDFGSIVFKNVFDLWFAPEIERRRNAGMIDETFQLLLAQAIMPEDRPPTIRLNDEVKGVMLVDVERPVAKGELATFGDLGAVQNFELLDEELDCGHFTIIRRPSGWLLSFNALRGRKKAANLVRLALEFLTTAKSALELGHAGPCIDNLFSSCELLSKAELIMHQMDAAKSKKHGPVQSAIHAWGNLGNVPAEFVATMKRLANLRSAARYEGTASQDDLPTQLEIETVQSFASHLKRRASPKIAG